MSEPSATASGDPATSAAASPAAASPAAASPAPARPRVLVIDSGPIIARAKFHEFSDELWSLREVVNKEIRDEAAKLFVDTLPQRIRFREPTPAAVTRVVDFARKTGDFSSLSSVDIKLLALAVTLELEHNGERYLRTEPKAMTQFVPGQDQAHGKAHTDAPSADSVSETTTGLPDDERAGAETESQAQEEPKVSADGSDAVAHDDDDDGSSSEGEDTEWITPDNFADKFGDDFVAADEQEHDRVPVLCMTTDFAMQNVILQMGLQLLSVNGMKISRVKKWMLRCFACYLCTKDMERVFCERCGNATLKRISVHVDRFGNISYYLSSRPLNTRGTKFSLPKPKCGSAKTPGSDLILTEDQLKRYEKAVLPMKKQHKKSSGLDFADPDYVFGTRPELSTVERKKLVGVGKRQPNRVKRKPRGNKRN